MRRGGPDVVWNQSIPSGVHDIDILRNEFTLGENKRIIRFPTRCELKPKFLLDNVLQVTFDCPR